MAERRIINGYIVERQPDGRLVTIGPAGGPAPQMPANPTFPYEGPKAAADLTRTTLDNRITQATLGAAIRKAEADAATAEANAQKAANDAKTGPAKNEEQIKSETRMADLQAMIKQINELQDLYNRNLAGQGVESVLEYFPTNANDRIDTLGAGIGQLGQSAFRVPGQGEQAVQEMLKFIAANEPSTTDRDAKFLGKLDNLRNRINSRVAAMGGEQINWVQPQNLRGQNNNDDQPLAAVAGSGSGRSAPLPTGPSFGGPNPDASGFVPYGSTQRRINNPEWQGVNDVVKGMIISGQSPEQIKAYLGQRGINQNVDGLNQAIQYYRKTGKQDFRVNVDDVTVTMSGMEQFRNNAPQTRLGTAAATFANATALGVPQALAPEQMQYLRDQNPVSAFAGDVGGIVTATGAIGKVGANLAQRTAPSLLTGGGRVGNAARAVAPDAVYGATYGGVTEGDPLTGAVTAAAGSGAGQLIGKGLQKGFQGVTDPAVQYLTQRDIPLTIGQTLGNRSIAGRMVNKMESVPILGDMLARNRVDGLKAFEREAINDVIAPLGGRVNAGGADGLRAAQDTVSQAYTDALSGVVVRPDAQFVADTGAALTAGRAVPKFGEDFDFMVNKEVAPLFNAPQLDGRQIQSALQSTGRIRSNFASNPDAMAGYAADAAGDLGNSISGMVSRQAPDVMPAYNMANQAYRGLVPFENARISGISQEAITPAQLARATTSNTKNYGGRGAAARGENLTDLMRYGQEVLPPTVPNSGTADRNAGLLSMFLPAAIGGGAIGLDQFTSAPSYVTAPLLALAALSTKTGQKVAQTALTKRPAAIRRVGGMFGSRKAKQGLAGMVTAPLLIED